MKHPHMRTRLNYQNIFIPIVVALWLLLSSYEGSCTTWATAYPYTIKTPGQETLIEGFPTDPYSHGTGYTKVYYKQKLLYTIDEYFRKPIFVSKDGRYLFAVVFPHEIESRLSDEKEKKRWYESYYVIDIYKDGKPYKKLSYNDVIGDRIIAESGLFNYWGYDCDYQELRDAKRECETCIEVYGDAVLATCDTSEIYLEECEKCNQQCELFRDQDVYIQLEQHSFYVKDDQLFCLTKYGVVVKIDMSDFNVTHIPFEDIIPNKKNYDPPLIGREEKQMEYPPYMHCPDLKDGTTFPQAVADLFQLSLKLDGQGKEKYTIHTQFDLDNKGRISDIYNSVYIDDKYTEDEKMDKKLDKWLKKQKIKTDWIPVGFDKFHFKDIIYLN